MVKTPIWRMHWISFNSQHFCSVVSCSYQCTCVNRSLRKLTRWTYHVANTYEHSVSQTLFFIQLRLKLIIGEVGCRAKILFRRIAVSWPEYLTLRHHDIQDVISCPLKLIELCVSMCFIFCYFSRNALEVGLICKRGSNELSGCLLIKGT